MTGARARRRVAAAPRWGPKGRRCTSGRHDCSARPSVEGGVVPSLKPPRGWVSSSPWLAAVPRSSGPVARPHVREKHVGGANLRLWQGLGEGGHKAVGKPGQALIVIDPAPTSLYGLGAVHVVGPGEVAAPPAAPAVAREGEPDVELPGGRAARVATVVLPARHVQRLASVVKG
jgi:hypothetical protein